jgi:hypothetical protein
MKTTTAPIYYRLKPAIVAPILVCGSVIGLAFVDSPWWLLSIPFAIFASMCAQPNLNLADGCLAYFTIMIGFGITFFHRPSGVAICIGTLASFYLSAFEKYLTAKPVYGDPIIDIGANPQNQEAEQAVPSDGHKPSSSVSTADSTTPADAH